jgi:hypothetical protein
MEISNFDKEIYDKLQKIMMNCLCETNNQQNQKNKKYFFCNQCYKPICEECNKEHHPHPTESLEQIFKDFMKVKSHEKEYSNKTFLNDLELSFSQLLPQQISSLIDSKNSVEESIRLTKSIKEEFHNLNLISIEITGNNNDRTSQFYKFYMLMGKIKYLLEKQNDLSSKIEKSDFQVNNRTQNKYKIENNVNSFFSSAIENSSLSVKKRKNDMEMSNNKNETLMIKNSNEKQNSSTYESNNLKFSQCKEGNIEINSIHFSINQSSISYLVENSNDKSFISIFNKSNQISSSQISFSIQKNENNNEISSSQIQILSVSSNTISYYCKYDKKIKEKRIIYSFPDSISFVNHNNTLHITGGKHENERKYFTVELIKMNDSPDEDCLGYKLINLADMNIGRYNHCSFIHEETLYVLGGNDLSEVERYDHDQHRWMNLPNMNKKRSRCCGMIVNTNSSQYLYAFLGYNGTQNDLRYPSTIERLNLDNFNQSNVDLFKKWQWEEIDIDHNKLDKYLKKHSSSILKPPNNNETVMILGGNDNRDIIEFNYNNNSFDLMKKNLPGMTSFINNDFFLMEGILINMDTKNKCYFYKDEKINILKNSI